MGATRTRTGVAWRADAAQAHANRLTGCGSSVQAGGRQGVEPIARNRNGRPRRVCYGGGNAPAAVGRQGSAFARFVPQPETLAATPLSPGRGCEGRGGGGTCQGCALLFKNLPCGRRGAHCHIECPAHTKKKSRPRNPPQPHVSLALPSSGGTCRAPWRTRNCR